MSNIQFPSVAAAGSTAIMGEDEVELLNKALTAGYGTDSVGFTGGAALRVESLDTVMKSTIQQNDHFKLFNALQKMKATATVDEWTERNSIGGFLGGTTNTETGNIRQAQGNYQRRVGLVKYLMTRCEVSLVSTLGTNIASSETVENEAGALRILTDTEFLSFEGDSAANAAEFDGIYAQMTNGVAAGDIDGGNVIDCEGLSLASIHKLNSAAAQIAGFGNFGRPTHLFMSQLTQSDFDNGLDPAFRVSLTDVNGGGTQIGAPVVGIRTSQGDIKTVNDVFIRDEMLQQPFEVMYPAIATAQTALQPTVAAPARVGDALSKFKAAHAGNYYYMICGLNGDGQSTGVKSSQVAVQAGDKVTLTITRSAGALETGYAIFRSRLNGTNNANDFRLIKRVACAGATTTFIDYNREIPGTAKAYVLNMSPGADAIAWRQLMPLLKFQLYPTAAAVLPWSQMLFGYLRLAKRRQHVVLKNIVTSGQVWKPFN